VSIPDGVWLIRRWLGVIQDSSGMERRRTRLRAQETVYLWAKIALTEGIIQRQTAL